MGGVQRPREEKGHWHRGGCGWLAAVCDRACSEVLQRFTVFYVSRDSMIVMFLISTDLRFAGRGIY